MNELHTNFVRLAVVAIATIAACSPARAEVGHGELARFYQGKTMRIIVGYGPGGGYDLYARLVARHMAKYIPGSPSIIVVNREGAGSLVAANALYATEPRDGTVIGTVSEGLPLLQRLGSKGVLFDAARFNWLGSAVQTTYACAARTSLAVGIQDLQKGRRLIMAGSSPGSSPYDVPIVIKEALGFDLKVVSGYRNTPILIQSIENGETDALCSTLSTLIEPAGRALLAGTPPLGKIFLVVASELPRTQADHPLVRGAPSAEAIATSAASRHLLAAFDAPAQMHKPFVAPPDVPPERVALLRKALAETFQNEEFKAEVAKSSLVASPVSGAATARIVETVLGMPDDTARVLQRILH